MIFTQSKFLYRLKLATLYVQMGQSDDALTLLEAEPGGEEGGTVTSSHSDTDMTDYDPRTEVEIKDKSLQVYHLL